MKGRLIRAVDFRFLMYNNKAINTTMTFFTFTISRNTLIPISLG